MMTTPLNVRERQKVTGIAMGRKFRRLHLLHGTAGRTTVGTKIATYRMHFCNGTQVDLPIFYGRNVRDWSCWPDEPIATTPSAIAWLGSNSNGTKVRLFHSTWDNPFPDVEVSSLDLVDEDGKCRPFLIALTVN